MASFPCPTCQKSVEWSPASPWRPFCSERCRLIDLGAWFSEKHAIPGENEPGEGVPDDDGEHRENDEVPRH